MKEAPPPRAAIHRSWRLARDWKALDEVRRYLEFGRRFCHTACREAAMMASWELAENVIKYGLLDGDQATGTMTIALWPGRTLIRTENKAHWVDGAHEVISTITRLKTAASVRELYIQRMQQLLTGEGQAYTRLGLLRVAYEGGFQLSYLHEAPRLQISADRHCDSPG
jgi:hypothetical protein